MIRFLDGPAADVVLQLRIAPLLLRVVSARAGHWDALDQPDDAAAPHEQIYLYRAIAKPTYMHLLCRGRGGKQASGWWATGDYRFLPEQPADSILRSNRKYAHWADLNRETLMPEWAKELERAAAKEGAQ